MVQCRWYKIIYKIIGKVFELLFHHGEIKKTKQSDVHYWIIYSIMSVRLYIKLYVVFFH